MTERLALMRPARQALRWRGPLVTPPAAVAPTLAAVDGVAGRVWTLTASATGTAPIAFALVFTVNGAPVALTPTVTDGVHVWTYTAPPPLEEALAWTLTATNGVGTADASGSRIIAAVAPDSAAINSVTFDAGGVLIDYDGNLADLFDAGGVILEAS